MDKRIAYRNIESTPVLEAFINERLNKIEKLLETERTPQRLDFVLTAENSNVLYKVELNITTPNYKLYAQNEGHDMHQQIDKVTDTMLDEIRVAKDKDTDHKNKSNYFKST